MQPAHALGFEDHAQTENTHIRLIYWSKISMINIPITKKMTSLRAPLHKSSSWELELGMIFGNLILGVNKFSSKAQSIENVTNLQYLRSLSKCYEPCSKLDIKGTLVLNRGAFRTSPRMIQVPLAWSLQNKSQTLGVPRDPHDFDQELVVFVPHGIHQGTI